MAVTPRVGARLTVRLNAVERRALDLAIASKKLPSAAAAVRLAIGRYLRDENAPGFAGKTDEELGYTEGIRQGFAAVNRALQESLKSGA